MESITFNIYQHITPIPSLPIHPYILNNYSKAVLPNPSNILYLLVCIIIILFTLNTLHIILFNTLKNRKYLMHYLQIYPYTKISNPCTLRILKISIISFSLNNCFYIIEPLLSIQKDYSSIHLILIIIFILYKILPIIIIINIFSDTIPHYATSYVHICRLLLQFMVCIITLLLTLNTSYIKIFNTHKNSKYLLHYLRE
eukprot:52211_1